MLSSETYRGIRSEREGELRELDSELERIRASPRPRSNPASRYILYFIFFTLALSFKDIRFRDEPEGVWLDIRRLPFEIAGGGRIKRIIHEMPSPSAEEGEEPDERDAVFRNAQMSIWRALEERWSIERGLLDWAVVLRFSGYSMYFGYNIFLNMLYAAGLSSVLFLRNRDQSSSRLIDRQNQELSILNRRQTIEMEETSKLLRDLSRTQSRLVGAEKLASIGRLSATLAHEIRNPLGIIASSVGMVAEDINPSSPSGQALELVRQEIHRLNKIITDLLNFARPRVPNPMFCDLSDLVRSWMAPHQDTLAGQNIELLAELDPALPEVYVDSDLLYQAFLNIMLNASEALREKPGGRILVTARPEGQDAAVLEIHDSGEGIPPETIPQVFEPFFTTKTAGSGLGLAVVKQAIESQGGSVEIESEPGWGTSVRLRLPTGPVSGMEPRTQAQTDASVSP